MSRLTFDIAMSLDGFITDPNPGPDAPIGDPGRLHDWMSGLTDYRADRRSATGTVDADVLEQVHAGRGAVVMGRAMFDVGEEPWGEDPPFGMPVFVVTHRGRDPIAMQGGTTYHFVTDGIHAALEQARAAAGGKDVGIAGGANLAQQYLDARLLDELLIHLVPVLLGDGVRLFDRLTGVPIELECTKVTPSAGVTHLEYRVRG